MVEFSERLKSDLKIIKEIIGKYSKDDVKRINEYEEEKYGCILYGVMGIVDRLYYGEEIMTDDDYLALCEIIDNTDNPYSFISHKPTECSKNNITRRK